MIRWLVGAIGLSVVAARTLAAEPLEIGIGWDITLGYLTVLPALILSGLMLYYVCQFNPFTHAVELIRFALYGQVNWISLAVVGGCTAVFKIGAIFAYDPSRGMAHRGPAGGET